MDDLKSLEINFSFEQIKNTPKATFAFKQLKQKVKTKALHFLISLQSKELKYAELQAYIRPGNSLTIKEKAFIFSARSRMINIKSNFIKENLT